MTRTATIAPTQGGPFLPVETIVKRATAEFECVVTDQSRAMQHLARELIAQKPGVDQRTADECLQPLAESVQMICADDPHSDEKFLKCFVVPGQPIEIVYHFDRHEEAAADLLARLARVLDYSVHD